MVSGDTIQYLLALLILMCLPMHHFFFFFLTYHFSVVSLLKIFIYFCLRQVSIALHRLSLVVTGWGYSQVVVRGCLIAVASLVVKHWSRFRASVGVV